MNLACFLMEMSRKVTFLLKIVLLKDEVFPKVAPWKWACCINVALSKFPSKVKVARTNLASFLKVVPT